MAIWEIASQWYALLGQRCILPLLSSKSPNATIIFEVLLLSISFGEQTFEKVCIGISSQRHFDFLQAYFVTLFFVPAALLSYPRQGGSSRLMAAVRSTYLLLTHPLVSKFNTASFSCLQYLTFSEYYKRGLITKYPKPVFRFQSIGDIAKLAPVFTKLAI